MKPVSDDDPGNERGGPGGAADAGALVFVACALAAFSVAPLRALFSAYVSDPNYSHGLLVLGVAVILAWRARARLFSAAARPGPGGFAPLLMGCGLVAFGHWYQIGLRPGSLGHVFLQGMGLLVAVAAVIWILAGRYRFRILLPVLGFLVFAVPWPESFTLPVTTALQRLVAIGATHLLRALGVEVFRDGNLLHLHSAVLGVAEACSGIRSLLAFFATAAACALFLSLGVWRTLWLFAWVPVAAVGSNILRILATSLLVLYGGSGWLHGPRHELLGLAAVLLGGGFLFVLARFLSRGAARPSPATPAAGLPLPRPALWPAAMAISLLLFATALGLRHVARHYECQVPPDAFVPVARLPLAEFPYAVGSYRCTDESRLSAKEYDLLQPSEQLVRTYEDPQGNGLLLTVLYWAAQRTYPGSAAITRYPHTPYSCMWGAGWIRETAYDDVARPAWLPDASLYTGGFVKAGRERLVLFWNTNAEEDPRPFSPKNLRQRGRLLVQSWTAVPTGILPATYSVRVETDIVTQPAQANDIALDFARQAADILPDFGIGRLPERALDGCLGDLPVAGRGMSGGGLK